MNLILELSKKFSKNISNQNQIYLITAGLI